MNFIGGVEPALLASGIEHLPPPLVRDDLDPEDIPFRRKGQQRMAREQAIDQKQQQHERREDQTTTDEQPARIALPNSTATPESCVEREGRDAEEDQKAASEH